MVIVQRDIPMSFQNVSFSSTKTRALSGVYTDAYDDGAVLHCFMFFFCLIVLSCPALLGRRH